MFNHYTSAGKQYNKLILGLVIMTILATTLFYSFLVRNNSRKSNAAIPSDIVTLSYKPQTTIISGTQEMLTAIKFEISSRPMVFQGYGIQSSFDTTKLQITHIQYQLGSPSAGLADTDATLAKVNSTGKINLYAELPNVNGQIITQGTDLVWITYKINSILGASPIFGTTVDQTGTFAALNPDNTLTAAQVSPSSFNVQTASFTPPATSITPVPQGNTTLHIKLKFQGITATSSASGALKVHLKLMNSGSAASYTQDVDFTPGTNGTWNGVMTVNVPQGGPSYLYSLYVKGPKHLKKRVCTNTPTETIPGTYNCATDGITLAIGSNDLDLTGIYQLAGDLPVSNGHQNGLIDAEDTTYIKLHFGDTTPPVLTTGDLNLDGVIDAQDYAIVVAALGVKYDDPEQ